MGRIKMFQEVDPEVNLCQLVEIMCPSTDL